MNTKAATNPPKCKRENVLIVLTTLVLACAVVVMMASGSFPLATASEKTTTIKERDCPSVETPKAKHNVTLTQPTETEPVSKLGEIIVEPVGDSKPRIPTEAEPQESLAPASALAAARLKSNLAPYSGARFTEFVGPIILTTAVVFALAVLAILVLVVCVFGLLRWHGQQFGPLIRIEYIGVPFLTKDAGIRSQEPGVRSQGASVTQEHQPVEASANRAQDALVQRMFEEALQLQVQIDLAREQQLISV